MGDESIEMVSSVGSESRINEQPVNNSNSNFLSKIKATWENFKERITRKKEKEAKLNELKKNVEIFCHKYSNEKIEEEFNTNIKSGLSDDQYNSKFETFGLNRFDVSKKNNEVLVLLSNFFGFFSILLLIGAILAIVSFGINGDSENLALGVILIIVVIITGSLGYYQERKSSNLMDSFKKLSSSSVRVLRSNEVSELSADYVVPGDVIILKAGDKVPADAIVVEASNDFSVDNSSLTGESLPIKKKPGYDHEDPMETQNLIFFGTFVVKGTSTCVVHLTGSNTLMGKIALLSSFQPKLKSTLRKEINRFVVIITIIALILGVVFFTVNALLGAEVFDNIVFIIGIIVANVPEGLLLTLTICLSVIAKSMSVRNVLVKDLEKIETLGSITVIASDKTGTLTQNVMTVVKLMCGTSLFDVKSSLSENDTFDINSNTFKNFLRLSTLNNNVQWDRNSRFDLDKEGKPIIDSPVPFMRETIDYTGKSQFVVNWKPIGDASESAISILAQRFNDIEEMREIYPKVAEIPFNSTNKFQVSVHKDQSRNIHFCVMKGAPEIVLSHCDKFFKEDGIVEITEELKSSISQNLETAAKNGLRNLAFATLDLDPEIYNDNYTYNVEEDLNFPLGFMDNRDPRSNEKTSQGLVYSGFCSLIDPPRPGLVNSIEKCKNAGIRVFMVTGDHPTTAESIAKSVGLIWTPTDEEIAKDPELQKRYPLDDFSRSRSIVINGSQFDNDCPNIIWKDVFTHYDQIVFARTTPQQKLIIVENLQALGEIVAVTGDGVNDSPALKKANIGIAMGLTGTEVSKEAADLILLDDSFNSVIVGIEQGRLIFNNMKKSIAYTLSSNIPEILPFLTYVLIRIPLPLTTIMILFIDLGTDLVPAISYAWEPAESDIMKRIPRDTNSDYLVTRKLIIFSYLEIGVVQALGGLLSYLVIMNDYGYPPQVLPGLTRFNDFGYYPLFCQVKGDFVFHFKDFTKTNESASFNVFRTGSFDSYEFFNSLMNLTVLPSSFQSFDRANRNGYYFIELKNGLGDLYKCVNPLKTFIGSDSNPPSGFDFYSSTGYNKFSSSAYVPTIESYQYLYDAGFYNYIPLRATQSSFWRNEWLAWNVSNHDVDGLYSVLSNKLKFKYQPLYVESCNLGTNSGSDLIGDSDLVDFVKKFSSSMFGYNLNNACTSSPSLNTSSANSSANTCVTTPGSSIADCLYPHFVSNIGTINIANRMAQIEAQRVAVSGYFISIIIAQYADLIICKTFLYSIRDQKFNNRIMEFGLMFETLLGITIVFAPFCNIIFQTRPLKLYHIFPTFPISFFIILYDEIRKFLIRLTTKVEIDAESHLHLRSSGWFERNTLY